MSKFSSLVTRLSSRLNELDINFLLFQTYLSTFASEHERFVDDLLRQETLPELFSAISRHKIWDSMNFDLASYLVDEFAKGDQICVELLADYKRDFTGYLLTTEIVHHIAAKREAGSTATPPESIPSEELCSKLTVKLDIDITTHSLKYVEEVWKTLLRRSQLPKHTLLLREIAKSSLMITWLVPKSKATELADAILENTHELRLKKVISVTINDVTVFEADAARDLNSSTDENGFTPLVNACASGAIWVIDDLLDRGADVNLSADITSEDWSGTITPLGMALVVGLYASTGITELLVKRGADVNALGFKGQVGKETVSMTNLILAAMNDLENPTKILLKHGADPNIKGESNGRAVTPLGMALVARKQKVAALLIEHGADVNTLAVDNKGQNVGSMTPLVLAAMRRLESNVVKLLLERSADANMKSEINGVTVTPLCVALYKYESEIAALLIEHGADVNTPSVDCKDGELFSSMTPLMVAVIDNSKESTKLLLERGADPNTKSEGNGLVVTALGVALNKGHEVVAKLLMENGADIDAMGLECKKGDNTDSTTHLMAAVMKGLMWSTKLLLERGADPNKRSVSEGRLVTPLYAALVNEHELIVALLIEHGANVKRPAEEYQDGQVTLSKTHLMVAAAKGLHKSANLLLKHGASLHKETRVTMQVSATALMFAANTNIARLLRLYGARVNFQASHGGHTALMVATEQGRYEVAKLLLEHDARVNLQDSEGMSAVMYAVLQDDKDIADLLMRYGANPKLRDRAGRSAYGIVSERYGKELQIRVDAAKASVDPGTTKSVAKQQSAATDQPKPITLAVTVNGLVSNLQNRFQGIFKDYHKDLSFEDSDESSDEAESEASSKDNEESSGKYEDSSKAVEDSSRDNEGKGTLV